MKLSELIAAYGDEDVQWQKLDDGINNLRMARDGVTMITFGTEQPFSLNGTDKFGIVVWLDRARLQEIVAASKRTPS